MSGETLLHYTYVQAQVGDHGEVSFANGKIDMTFTEAGKTDHDSDNLEPDTVVAPLVQPFLAKHWDEIAKGDSVKVRYLALERLDTIGFKFFKDGERTYKGQAAVDVLMKPSSFFIAALVTPIRITVQKAAPHWILETEGRLPIRWPQRTPPQSRGDWKAIDARVEYDLPVAAPAPAPSSPPPRPSRKKVKHSFFLFKGARFLTERFLVINSLVVPYFGHER